MSRGLSETDHDLVAAFLAKRPVTVVGPRRALPMAPPSRLAHAPTRPQPHHDDDERNDEAWAKADAKHVERCRRTANGGFPALSERRGRAGERIACLPLVWPGRAK